MILGSPHSTKTSSLKGTDSIDDTDAQDSRTISYYTVMLEIVLTNSSNHLDFITTTYAYHSLQIRHPSGKN